MITSVQDLVESGQIVAYANRIALPQLSGIYFITDGQSVFYIGQATNLRNRVGPNHHKLKVIQTLEDCYVGYVFVEDTNKLTTEEVKYIQHFKPIYNATGIGGARDQRITTVFTKEEKQLVVKTAENDGLRTSEWMRNAALFYLKAKRLTPILRELLGLE